MSENKFEIWVIDTEISRRYSLTIQIMDLGYLTFHADPIKNILEIYERPVVAIVHDDGHSVDRILDYRRKRPISCVAYSGSWKARRANELLRQGVAALIEWPCRSQQVTKAVAAAASGLSTHVDDAWLGARARKRVEALSFHDRAVLR